ncbi:hypothetical protein DL93DRAFT_2102322 [Clavulina sp. PMI_390]|nr:hypothetical protein DL93DRAFT_2102322 [Clavulina sp. PMI_390]
MVGETDFTSLKSVIRFHDSRIPPVSDTIDNSDSNILFSHAALYGSSAILHSLFARDDVEARSEMLRSAQKLVEICRTVRGHEHLRSVQSSIVPMVHMMNAIRIFAHELRRLDVQEKIALANEYIHSIELLLDFLDTMTALYPAWTDSTKSLGEAVVASIKLASQDVNELLILAAGCTSPLEMTQSITHDCTIVIGQPEQICVIYMGIWPSHFFFR